MLPIYASARAVSLPSGPLLVRNKAAKLLCNHFISPTSPVEVVLYLTDKCNLACTFCDLGVARRQGRAPRPRELSTRQLAKLLDAMAAMEVGNLYLTGGEPFVAQNIWYLLESCAARGVTVDGITTNGSLLGKLTDQQIATLNGAPVRKIIISVDHADGAKHDAARGRPGLLASIESFLNSPTSARLKAPYSLSTLVSNENYRELEAIVEWASSLKNIRHINFQPVCTQSIFVDYGPAGGEREAFHIGEQSLGELQAGIDSALRKAKSLNISTSLPLLKVWIADYFRYARAETFFFDHVMRGHVCSKPYNYLHVNYNGDLLACTHIYPMGNIDDGDIAQLWRTGARRYKQILEKRRYFSECRNCFCDFPANYRHSLLYRPIKNAAHLGRMASYYAGRWARGS